LVSSVPSEIENFVLTTFFETVMFSFTAVNDIDLDSYAYELYDNELGEGTPIETGRNKANVFTVSVQNSSLSIPSGEVGIYSASSYWGRVAVVNSAGIVGSFTELVGGQPTPLIGDQYLETLTAAKITAGTIGAHTITLAGANSIIKSSIYNSTQGWQIDGLGNATFNTATIRGQFSSGTSPNWFRVDNTGQIWLGADTYAGAANKFRVSNTGSLTAALGRIGPFEITQSSFISQSYSPNNYMKIENYGDVSIYSNPSSGDHENTVHETTLVGEYIVVGDVTPGVVGRYALMGSPQSNPNGIEFSIEDSGFTKFNAKSNGIVYASTSFSAPTINGTGSVNGYNIQATKNLNIGNNSSAGPVYVNSNSIEIQTDTSFGGIYDAHTGYAIYSTMSVGWGNAELLFQCSNNWQSYAYNPVAFKIGQSTVTASGYAYFSDKRLKENIVDCNFGLKEIVQLNPKNYNLIQDGLIKPINENDPLVQARTRTGLIAQEVLDVIPSIVSGGEGEEYYSLDYNMIIPILINAIKELSAKVDELESGLI
jgi:hypothetical protein